MPVVLNTPGWKIRSAGASRGVARSGGDALPGLRPDFLTGASDVIDEVILETAPRTRGLDTGTDALDLTCDVGSKRTAMLAIRLPSGALTFHRPLPATSRSARGPSKARFKVEIRRPATRGLVGQVVKAIVIEVAKLGLDKGVSLALPKLAEAFEKTAWKKLSLKEGWVRVTDEALSAGVLEAARPVSSERSLLLIHGTFTNAATEFCALAGSTFFKRLAATYGDRIYAFNHFSVSRSPEQNARMLLESLPDHTTTFDVVAHSRGGLVLRNLVERSAILGAHSRRFKLGRAVLVACPNEGTPLATPGRWEHTVGWLANLLEMLPDNPFTTGASFVANGLVWVANHASGDLPGLHSMDGDGELIAAIQGPPGPPADAYSALVANYDPSADTLRRLLDAGIDQFFSAANDLMVPTEGGWRIDRSATGHVPASRIGCFGPGGNLPADSVTHNTFYSQPATIEFLVNGLLGRPHNLDRIDPRKRLPDRRLLRGAVMAARAKEKGLKADMTAAAKQKKGGTGSPLRITVTNGDLTYIAEPLLIGHYRSAKLSGAEAVMDRAIGHAMSASLDRGLYPTGADTHQVFVNTKQSSENPWQLPRPAAVIVAGLGAEGELRGSDLVKTVRQSVIAWGQRLTELPEVPDAFSLATTLLGSGGAGITAGQAAQLIAQGVREANDQMAGKGNGGRRWPCVRDLQIIELYLDRATEAWRSLQGLEEASPALFKISPVIEEGIGALRRPPEGGYRGAEYDFISALVHKSEDNEDRIVYTIDTKRARSEVRAQAAQLPLIRNLVSTASNSANTDGQIGRTLFSLLVPVDLEPFMGSSSATVIQLDSGTAAIPWELLDSVTPGSGDDRPWAIRTKLLRKLRTDGGGSPVNDASADDSVLVIGDPACDRDRYPRLFGARREATAVAECLSPPRSGRGARQREAAPFVTALISPQEYDGTEPDANAVLNATMSRAWRIIHIAGHGEPPLTGPNKSPRGVVLSNESYLGPAEIGALRVIPELVFVNCCHLASSDESLLLKPSTYDRAQFASGVAEALIKAGVRCVVAAGWAIDDDTASVFATTFYARLLDGSRFIDAVHAARSAARESGGNTWAAYQCYGDPDWQFRRGTGDAQRPSPPPPSEELAGIPSVFALVLTLKTLAVKSEFQNADTAEQAARLEYLEKSAERLWRNNGESAEAFGNAWAKAGNFDRAITWYERARVAPDGTASLAAIEQLANLKVRRACEDVTTPSTNNRSAQQKARKEITEAMALMGTLLSVGATVERESLYGSAYKRLALIEAAAGREDAEIEAISRMRDHYNAAEQIARSDAANGKVNLYYPVMNRIAAQLALEGGTGRASSLDAQTLATVQRLMAAAPVDFWSVVGQTELKMYASLFGGTLEKDVRRLTEDFKDHHSRVSAPKRWASVLDSASFVLLKYKSRAKRAEAAAAGRLLEELAELAGRKRPASGSSRSRSTKRGKRR
jgi:tetratricopeptide (TPR) repeat protein